MKPNLGDVIADKYRLDRVLGEGGMSTVYAAANVVTGKQVAIKWLQPELIRDEEQSQRLLREAQVTSSIDHPNVVNVFDIGRHEGALFLVMELLHGEPLSELLMRGHQDAYEFVKLMMPVLRGVHAAHRGGIVHRDLKPDNIFICTDMHGDAREPKVLDFGISKLASDALTPGQELTREGTVFGTPQYMAPEQMRDARCADARSDVYALGVIFYRAFSNEYPYDADTLTALAIRIVEGNAQPLHELCLGLDLGLCDVIMRALALDPEQRFASVAALGQALEPYANGALFAPGSFDRDSLPFPRRDSSLPSAAVMPSSRQLAPPPPPPRTGAMRDNPAARSETESDTRLIDASDLIGESESYERDSFSVLAEADAIAESGSTSTHAPSSPPAHAPSSPPALAVSTLPRRDSKLSVPPPPPSTARPSRGLEVVVDDAYSTQRVDRTGRRHNWGLAASLVVIGLLAPAGWQQWQKARGAALQGPTRPAQAPVTGKTADVYAAQALRPSHQPKPAAPAAPIAVEPPAPLFEQPAAQAPQEASLGGMSSSEPMAVPPPVAALPAQLLEAEAGAGAPAAANKPVPVAPTKADWEKRKRRLAAAPAPVPVTTQLVERAPEDKSDKPSEAPATQQTERNPYLRR